MSIDKNKITTQDELNEPAPMDQADKRVEKEMKELEKDGKISRQRFTTILELYLFPRTLDV